MGEILLVEPFETEEANSLISDPSKYVSVTAQTKDSIKAKVEEAYGAGVAPIYKFYNPTSKVTLVDSSDGKNLVNGEYYNYVAMVGDKLFLAKNTADADVLEFSIADRKFVEDKIENVPNELDGVYDNDIVVDSISPVDESVQDAESFDSILGETPLEKVDSSSELEIVDSYTEPEKTDTEKRLEELNDLFVGANEDINAYINNDDDQVLKDYYGVDDRFTSSNFKVDSIDKIEDEKDTGFTGEVEEVDDTAVKEFVQAFEELRQGNTAKDRELSESRSVIEKYRSEVEKGKAIIRSQEQKNEVASATIRELRDALAKQTAATERAKNTADILKGKADGYKYELAEKDREIERLKSQVEALDYIKEAWERYKVSMDYNVSYNDTEDSYIK